MRILDGLRTAAGGVGRWLAAVMGPVTSIAHPVAGATLGMLLNRTRFNYEREARPDANSIVMACVNYLGRVASDAPLMLEEWLPDREEWKPHHRDEVLDLLERPNPFYAWSAMLKALVSDLTIGDGGGGNAYVIKLRNNTGQVVQLWWAPAQLIEPKADPDDPKVFISHYEYKPGRGEPAKLPVSEVIHLRDGMDPSNPRKGAAKMKSLFREVFTDDEAANYTASMMRNMGVPGVILSPNEGMISSESAEEIKNTFMQKFTGDKRGEPMVTGGPIKVEQFGFNPQEMQVRELRGVPEERITAALGVSAAVVGLGTGLAQTKVGATLREYREHDIETTVVPMWREMAAELTHQLLGDFKTEAGTRGDWRVVFDLSKVRVLQEDENKRSLRIERLVAASIIRLSEGRRALGFPVMPEHEVWMRKSGVTVVPATEDLSQAQDVSEEAAADERLAAQLERDGEQLAAALERRLVGYQGDAANVFAAHWMLVAERTFEAVGVEITPEVRDQASDEGRKRGGEPSSGPSAASPARPSTGSGWRETSVGMTAAAQKWAIERAAGMAREVAA